jgi:uncharacterized membrane protein
MRFPLQVNRNPNIDLIRGFAIILMVLDHALLAIATIFGSNEYIYFLRVTLTRFSMPLFMIVSGSVLYLYGIKIKRWLTVFCLALLINLFAITLWEDFNSPEILLVWTFVVVFIKFILKYPLVSLIIGFIQNQYFPIHIFDYSGYQPGEIVIFLVIGIFASTYITNLSFPILSKFMIYNLIIFIGKKPLTIYFTHLLFISATVYYLTPL